MQHHVMGRITTLRPKESLKDKRGLRKCFNGREIIAW